MYKILRILFCILTVALAAAAVFVFIYAGWIWGCLVIVCAFVFGALMVTFKQLQEKEEKKKNPPPPQGDFIFGKPSDENKETVKKPAIIFSTVFFTQTTAMCR